MARFTKAEKEKKILHAKALFCKGFDIETIAEIFGDVKPATLATWAKEGSFEQAKRVQNLGLAELRNSIVESYADLLEGRTPKIKPDDAAKYAKAFDTFSSEKKATIFMKDNFDELTEEIIKQIQKARTKKDKEFLLAVLKWNRNAMDTVLTRSINNSIGNE